MFSLLLGADRPCGWGKEIPVLQSLCGDRSIASLAGGFVSSMRLIWDNPHINRGAGLFRYLVWQTRRGLNLFPFEQSISASRIIAPSGECLTSALIHIHGLYNYDNMRFVKAMLRAGDVFFDVGAHIGSFTLVASEMPHVRVFAFEPHPGTYRLLKANIDLNDRHNVVLHNVALGERRKEVFLTDRPGSGCNHLVADPTGGVVPVSCRRADDLCREHHVRPRGAKIDVEGFEYEVLVGFGDYVRELDFVLLEINGLSDARGAGEARTHAWLLEQGMTGPWQCAYDERLIRRRGARTHDDSLYLSGRAKDELVRTHGFSVQDAS